MQEPCQAAESSSIVGGGSVDIVVLITRAVHAFRRKADEELGRNFDVTYSQASAIHYLAAFGGMRQSTLAKYLESDEGAVSRLVSRLVRKRLLAKNRATMTALELTVEGQALAVKLAQWFQTLHVLPFPNLFPEEHQHLRSLLSRMLRNILTSSATEFGSSKGPINLMKLMCVKTDRMG